MKSKLILVTIILLVIMSSQLFAFPNLYLGGSGGTLIDPAVDVSSSYWLWSDGDRLEFTLIYEETQNADFNSFYLHEDFNSAAITHTVFNASDGAGARKALTLNGEYGLSMFTDLNLNGVLDLENNESWAFSNVGLNTPAQSRPYQMLRPYAVGDIGVADYYFEEGDLSFTGDYDLFVFIDDGLISDGNGDSDFNDMIIGINTVVVPEPGTLLLIGLGLAGAGLIRRRK